MNGRIYDPLLGRMLSADTTVQFAGNLQSYNRYSYVQNNPLTLIDPSGFNVWVDAYSRTQADVYWEKTFGAEKAEQFRQLRREGDKGTLIGGSIAFGVGAAIVAGPVVVAKEVGSEIVDTTVENATGVPMATSIRGLAKDLWQWGAKKMGRETAKAAGETAAKQAKELAGSTSAPARLDAGAPTTPSAPEAGTLSKTGNVGSTDDFAINLSGGQKGIVATIDNKGVVDFMVEAGKDSPMKGSEMFTKMMAHFGDNVKALAGNWTYGDNLAAVNKLTAGGMSLQDAVAKTWTASQASKHGFKNIAIEVAEGEAGKYTKIRTLFSR